MKNLFRYENYVRVTIGILIVALSVHFQSYFWIPIGLILLYTGTQNSCPIYSILGINILKAKEQFYLSELPKYNPEPTFIYSNSGELKYKNKNCSDELIKQVTPLIDELNENPSNHTVKLENQTYFINFEFPHNLDLIFGYAFDATELTELQQEIISTQKEIVYKMGEIGETRSKETGNHVKRVAEYSYLLAKMHGLSEEDAQILKTASPMHDIGKVGIPDAILKKPAKLNEEEWEVMKTHALLGYDLLKHSKRPIIKAASIVAKEHHEKFDGTGYPNGLKGEEIHIYGRITALADVFDALGSQRVYKKAWKLEDILELFKSESGKHFDPQLTSLFLENIEEFLIIRDKFKDY